MSIFEYIPLILRGTGITLISWLLSAAASLLFGTILGILSCNYLGLSKTKLATQTFTFITKGVPAYVQILIAYFVIPSLLGINMSGFVAATGALALCSSGYVTEIIRAGINSIPKGQWDACHVLAYPITSAIKRIIFPQAIKNILPAIIGELEQLLKSTALLATIGVTELTRAGMNIISRELNPIPIYLTIALIYLVLSAILNILSRRVNYAVS